MLWECRSELLSVNVKLRMQTTSRDLKELCASKPGSFSQHEPWVGTAKKKGMNSENQGVIGAPVGRHRESLHWAGCLGLSPSEFDWVHDKPSESTSKVHGLPM